MTIAHDRFFLILSWRRGAEVKTMARDQSVEAWRLAQEMARSGQYSAASHLEDVLRSMGYSSEVDSWRGNWKQDRLNQLCRDSAEPNDARGGF